MPSIDFRSYATQAAAMPRHSSTRMRTHLIYLWRLVRTFFALINYLDAAFFGFRVDCDFNANALIYNQRMGAIHLSVTARMCRDQVQRGDRKYVNRSVELLFAPIVHVLF